MAGDSEFDSVHAILACTTKQTGQNTACTGRDYCQKSPQYTNQTQTAILTVPDLAPVDRPQIR